MAALPLLAPDETANDLLRRLDRRAFSLRLSGAAEELRFREAVEVITPPSDLAEFVLTAALEFAAQVEDGTVLHVSLGNSLFHSLCLSGVDIASSPLFHLHERGRVKAATVHTLTQLLALCEYLRTSLREERVLILLEGLTGLFSAQKTPQGTLPPTSLVHGVLTAFQKLSQQRSVTSVWVNSAAVKGSGGLRDGSFRDPVSLAWRQRVPKHFLYASPRR